VFSDGSSVEGHFANNRPHGKLAVARFASGAEYTGEWANGRFNGHGVLKYPSGGTYAGTFVDGKRHGKGKLVLRSGNVYVGDFADDQYHGRGRYRNTMG
jgi:hypothetical protein